MPKDKPERVAPINVGSISIMKFPGSLIVWVMGEQMEQERVVIRNHLEAETLARALADVFGENTFKVIRARSPGKRFSA